MTLVLVAGLSLPLTGPSAAVVDRDGYVADSAARALEISVGTTSQTLGATQARVQSSPLAKATGAGRLTDLSTTSTAEVKDSDGASPAAAPKCAASPVSLPSAIPIGLLVAPACSTAQASITSGLPSAKGTGQVVAIDLDAHSLLNTVISAVQSQLTTVFGAIPSTLDPAKNTVKDFLAAVGSSKTALIRVGTSTTESTADATKVTGKATAAGATIDILPNTTQFGDYFIRIEVGSATASVTHNRTGDLASSATFDPAVVRVLFAKNLAGQTLAPIVLAPGTDQTVGTVLAGIDLETTIKAGKGAKYTLADGSVAAVADAVSIHLFKGVSGGILLRIAHAEAAVAGTPLRVTKVANPKSVPVGNTFVTTITIENPFECAVEHVRVDDVLSVQDGARFKINGTDPKANTVVSGEKLSAGTILWNDIGTIPPHQSKAVTVTTLAQGDQSGKIIDVATATGTLGACPASAIAGAQVVAAALTQVPVAAVVRLEVPVQLPRTGASGRTTAAAGAALIGFAVLGMLARRRIV